MSKNIIICSDGTGNTANKNRGTNVFKLFEAVDRHGHLTHPELTPQMTVYDDGVGTESLKLLRLITGAVGWGLSRNVRQLYTELVRIYRPGDRIFLFGFSRGAFTVRTLAGFIGNCGLLDSEKVGPHHELDDAVKLLYKTYRKRYRTWCGKAWRWALAGVLRLFGRNVRSTSPVRPCPHLPYHPEPEPEKKAVIAFLGVWDTVDAVGLPVAWAAWLLNAAIYRFKFPDHQLGDYVKMARHAVSIDDARYTFHPLLWDESSEPPDSGRIEQVWFAGVHANVGGGYPKQGLSLVTLDWMVSHAETAGLRLLPPQREFIRFGRNVHDKLYDSRAGLAVYYRYRPRNLEAIPNRRLRSKVHVSVLERLLSGTDAYAPGNLPEDCLFVKFHPETGKTVTAMDPGAHLSNALEGKGPLSRQARFPTTVRRFAHYGLFLATALVLAAALKTNSSLDGPVFQADSFALFRIVWDNPAAFGLPLMLLMAAYFISLWARIRMHRLFGAYWHRCRPALRRAWETRAPG